MATWQSVVEGALLEIAVLSPSAVPKQTDLDLGLDRLAGEIALWSADGNLVPRLSEYTLTVASPAKRKYLIGTSDDADYHTAPVRELKALNYWPQDYQDPYELELVNYGSLTDRLYAEGTRPSAYFYEVADPDSVLHLDSPALPGDRLILVGYGYLATELALAQLTGLPAEYELALKLNLAVALAPGFGVQVNRITAMRARDAKRVLRKRNRKRPTVRFDPALATMNYGADSSYYGRLNRRR